MKRLYEQDREDVLEVILGAVDIDRHRVMTLLDRLRDVVREVLPLLAIVRFFLHFAVTYKVVLKTGFQGTYLAQGRLRRSSTGGAKSFRTGQSCGWGFCLHGVARLLRRRLVRCEIGLNNLRPLEVGYCSAGELSSVAR